MKDERFVKTGEDAYRWLNLQQFPNFHESGNIEGMRNLYYGKDACLVHSGHYIYHVDEDTFNAVKDFNTVELQPEWLMKQVKELTNKQIEEYRNHVTNPQLVKIVEEKDLAIRKVLDNYGFNNESHETVEALATQEYGKNDARVDNAKKAMFAVHNATYVYDDKYMSCQHGQRVMELAVQSDMLQQVKARMRSGITDVWLKGYDGESGKYNVAYKLDGFRQPDFQVSEADSNRIDIMLDEEAITVLQEMVAKYQGEKLFAPLNKEQQTDMKMSQASEKDEVNMYEMTEKISAVLEKFYSLNEADDLTRIITDPNKGVEDVKAMMNVIDYRNRMEHANGNLAERITQAAFLFPNNQRVLLSVSIGDYKMPFRQLTERDAQTVKNMGLQVMDETEIEALAKDFAETYYEKELRMDDARLADMTAEEGMDLTPQDARTYDDLERVLEAKYPEGLTIQMAGLKTDDLWGFVLYNRLRDDDITLEGVGRDAIPNDEYLQAEALRFLTASPDVYYSQGYEEFLENLENGEVYDAATTELMHRCPDLQDARFIMDERQLVKYLYIEGEPLDKVLSWMLQNPELREERLKTVLKDPIEAQCELQAVRDSFKEIQKEGKVYENMPDNLYMNKNSEYIYFKMPGVLGHAKVDRLRGVTYSGDTLPRDVQDYINDFTANANLESVRPKRAFFVEPGRDSEQRLYLDEMGDKLVRVDHQKGMDGKTIHTDGVNIISELDMKHLQDITGRITDAVIVGIDKPMVRCKIDGVQQMAQKLTKPEIIRMGGISAGSDEMKNFAMSTAVKHFATELYLKEGQEQNRGMKL